MGHYKIVVTIWQKRVRRLHLGKYSGTALFTLPNKAKKSAAGYTANKSFLPFFLQGNLGNCLCIDRKCRMEQNVTQRIKILPEVLKPTAFAFITITSVDTLLIFSVWITSFNLPSLPWGKHYYNTVTISWDVKLGWVVRSLAHAMVGHRASQWQSFTTPSHMHNRWYFSDLCLHIYSRLP